MINLRGKARARAGACLRTAAALVLLVMLLALGLSACSGGLSQARAAAESGDSVAAVSFYRAYLAENPDDVAALDELAVILYLQGQYDEALPLQEQVVALDASDVQTRVELGFNYLGHQDRPADGVRVLSEAVELEPSAKHLNFLAQALTASGEASAAEQALRRAVDTDPDYSFSYTQLANLLKAQGRLDEAEQVARQASSRGITISN